MPFRMRRTNFLWFLSVVTLFRASFISGSMQDQIGEVSHVCCEAGVRHARAQAPADCSAAVPPPDVPTSYGTLCLFAMDGCCQDHIKEKKDCEKGKLLAPDKECTKISSEIGQNCCEECSVGRMAGASQGRAACRAGGGGSDEEDLGSATSLRKEAYTACCLEAAAEQEGNPTETSKPTTSAGAASICEQFAPDELCAHHCIPVPGSYRCECNPGYMLMPDGKSCKKVEKNRCKPHNQCQHKCIDNGKEVKCSCRRGFELMADKKSCKDIDECVLEMAVCAAGTSCHNTEGSYKCVPAAARGATNDYGGSCPSGFERNNEKQVCDDINECELPSLPCPKNQCVNTVGGYKCAGVAGRPQARSPAARAPAAAPAQPPRDDLCPSGFRIGVDGDCVDIDECAEKTSDCNLQSQFCLNTHGSFACQDRASRHCAPGFKLHAATGVCVDIDECLESQELCAADQECVNVPGAYLCKGNSQPRAKLPKSCPEGTRIKPGGKICEDIDECREGSHLCDQYQDCLNSFGSHECRCKIGFRLDPTTGACTDINECATSDMNDCMAQSQRCDNTVGSYVCTRFTSCGTGYVLHAATGQCEDVDECAHKLDNCARAGPGFTCVNLPGTFRCTRRRASTTSTTTHAPWEYEYYDSDEELPIENNETQPKPSQPEPTQTTPKKEPQTTPTSRPTESTTPETTTTEIPIVPTTAYQTYVQTPATTPETKPPTDQRPEENSTTVDLEPDTTYDNNKPFTAPSSTTEPENKVEITPRPKSELPQVVLVKPPEDPIFIPREKDENGTVVVDTKDIPKNRWTNVIGLEKEKEPELEEKRCLNGYHMNEFGDCIDVDECTEGLHVCSSLTETCRNTDGGYQCDCAAGFIKDQRSGWCQAVTSSTSTTTSTTTTTTAAPPTEGRRGVWSPTRWPYKPFRPRLECDVGYQLNANNGKCEDVDECAAGVASCANVELCVNTDGGYRCECPPGWRLDAAGHRCVPARETGFPTGYGNINTDPPTSSVGTASVITVGSQYGSRGSQYVNPRVQQLPGSGGIITSCPWGYRLDDDGRCVDVDECANGIAECGATQQCVNHAGGYSCRCPAGHRLEAADSSAAHCEDIDECALSQGRYCSPHSDCVNTIGSYLCRCHAGFRAAPANEKVCVDIDECAESRPGTLCHHTCNNVWGGHRCSCRAGYRLQPDNRTCADVDECSEYAQRNLCVGRCRNEPGSYSCSCPSGYRLGSDKRSCIDIDECESGEAACAAPGGDRFCQNTRGGYKCHQVTCPPGYKLEKKHRCTRVARACAVGDWDCLHQPSTYSYNFITFVSRLYIPPSPVNHVDLFTMRGPSWQNSALKFQLRLLNVNTPPSVRRPADLSCFLLTPSANQAVVSLSESLVGPQSIELELSMELYTENSFGGIAVAKIFIYVSEFEF